MARTRGKVLDRRRAYKGKGLTRPQQRAAERLDSATRGHEALVAATDTKYQKGPHKPGKMDHT